jgi:fatty acid desaturase|tara:strand:+ start:30603 stop:31604 length:1002 start_codon:yes stop_codon:yes gene_type:complete
MTASVSSSEQAGIEFTDEERLYYRRPKIPRLIFDLSMPWLQAVLGCALFIAYPSIWSWLVAIFVIAGGQHGLSLIAHEASHLLVCPQNKRINDWIGMYLFAAPTILPFNVYRQRHVIHHRLVSQPGDTKNVYLRDWRGWLFFSEVVKSISGADYLFKVRDVLQTGKGDEYEKFDTHLRRDQIRIIVVNAIIFGAITLFDPLHYGIPTYYFILWLWPMLTLSFLFAKIRALIEHQPARNGMSTTEETPYFMNTPGPMLRSVKASWIERLFLSKINFHYHAEHHLWPWISYQHLPEINSRIWEGHENEESLIIKGNFVVVGDTYTAGIKDVIRGK